MNSYQPGQSVRSTVAASLLGLGPTDTSPPPVCSVHGPDGTLLTPTVVHDAGTGNYHADWSLPVTARPGNGWARRWRATGADPSECANVDTPFAVQALQF